MAPWRCDPYLWVHLAGLATVPLWIDLCLLGLAVGNPVLPGLELGVIVALGVLPVLVMQLRQPFYIFSLLGLALKPAALQDDQRRLLSQFRRWRVRLGALLVPVPLVWGLLKLYPLAFLARDLTPFSDWGRLGGVAIAVLSFFMANLFLQIPIAVLQVLATPDRVMTKVAPYPIENVAADFTWIGLTVGKILPDLINRPRPESATAAMVETFEPPQVVPVGVLDEPEGGVAEAIVETEVPLEHALEAGATDDLAAHIRASDLSVSSDLAASSKAIAGAVDPENPKDSVAADSFVDSDATSGYKPLRHPEVEESSDDTAHLDDAAYPQSLPAIVDVYPNSR
ncbi:low-complexity tail membrane protein [Nodosilinea sp. FACHB-13]|uniref:low-complexity tail membrane protein n=1 Tax=Cyanophyceae TaxID=3028117 RepID=UPI0016882845|nr:low-complexity tail membrane protein [Nodosilinea sp. FACHB-13]MBD2106651.1 low-complexity tail membrane protein [Nodosilinea sp. FACHB-13]